MKRKTEIETAAYDYAKDISLLNTARQGFVRGAEWADEHPVKHWKSADGDDLPDIDREGRQNKSQRSSLGSAFVRFCENMAGLLLYSLLFCLLLGIANPTLSTREFVGYSLIFGFFAGLISNIERVMRELDKKNAGETTT